MNNTLPRQTISYSLIAVLLVFLPAVMAKAYPEPPYIPVAKPTPINTVTVCPSGCEYTSLAAADSAAQPGWLIQIRAGTYVAPGSWSSSGTDGNDIVIEPFGDGEVYFQVLQGRDFEILGDHVIFDGGPDREITLMKDPAADAAKSLLRLRGDHQTISRLKISGPTGDCAIQNPQTNNAGVRPNTKVSGADITNKNWKPSNFKIYNTVIDNCDHKGIYFASGRNGEIRNNIIGNTGNTGIQLNPNDTGLGIYNAEISGNYFFANGYCTNLIGHNIAIFGGGGGTIENVRVTNNIFYGSRRSGIQVQPANSSIIRNLSIIHNTFYDNGQAAVYLAGTMSSNEVTIRNNIAFQNYRISGNYDYDDGNSGTIIAEKNIGSIAPSNQFTHQPVTTDPLFMTTDSNSPDFLKLSSGSTDAIDQGVDAGVSSDYFGSTRDAIPDIGAHEYQGDGQDCGNNIREGSEICDGADRNGQTCITLGYSGGTLSCQHNCSAFDMTDCVSSSRPRAPKNLHILENK